MANIIIILVMLTVLMGAGAYGVISSSKILQTNIEKLMIEDRLEEAAQGVLNNIVSTTSLSTQTYSVPAPDNLAAPAVPSWIDPNAQTARGVKFLYCPFSNASGSGSTITTGTSDTYSATIGTIYSGSENYVTASTVGSGTRPTNASTALAIIVAPGPNQTTAPDCQNVTAAGTLAGAQVRIITENEVQSRAQVVASAGNEFYVAATASGDYSGRNASNPVDLGTVITYSAQYRPQATKIDLAAGTYYLDNTNLAESNITSREFSVVRNRSVYFSGAGPASSLFKSAATTAFQPHVLGATLYQNVGFPAVDNLLVQPPAYNLGNVIADNSNIQYVSAANGGRAYFIGSNTLSGNDVGGQSGTAIFNASGDGQIYFGGNIIGPPNAYTASNASISSLGQVIIGSNAIMVQQGNLGAEMVSLSTGAELVDQGTFIQTQTSNLPFWNHSLARMVFSGATFNNIYSYIMAVAAPTAFDRGTIININSSSAPSYLILGYGGGELDITNSTLGSSSTNSLRPSTDSFNLNWNGWKAEVFGMGGGTTGGWTGAVLTGQSTTACASIANTSTSYHMISDSANTNGSTFLPRGNITYEPLIILNRAGWTCTHP